MSSDSPLYSSFKSSSSSPSSPSALLPPSSTSTSTPLTSSARLLFSSYGGPSIASLSMNSPSLTPAQCSRILQSFLPLYDSRSSPSTFTSSFHVISPTMKFLDPVVEVQNQRDYRLQFASLRYFFSDFYIENESFYVSATDNRIYMDMIVVYNISKYFSIRLRQITRLDLDDSKQIIRHEDIWSFKDLLDGIPLVGRATKWGRKMVGTLTSEAFEWWGIR